jgi:Skp family chaperone for outer membrane proteins
VNIAKILKDYDKANAMGKQISELRQGYLTKVNDLRMQLSEKNKMLPTISDSAKKEALDKEMRAITRQIEDIDQQAQKTLGEMSNNTVVTVYKEIKETITAIAEANGLELVMAYPDASEQKDMDSPVVAQIKLQTPALMPFYHKNIDITKYVVDTLNQRYPAPKSTAGAGTADPHVKPVGAGLKN